jgi:hypothetical protein
MYCGLCCAVGPAIPPPTPTQAHGLGLTALSLAAALRGGQRLRRGAFGASGSATSVSRPIYRILCRVYIPLSTLPILLSPPGRLFSMLRACQID